MQSLAFSILAGTPLEHLTFRRRTVCSGWHHRGSLPGLTLMPDSHPGRLGPTVGWTSLQPFHPSLGACPFISADITSGCLGFGQMPGPSKRGPLDQLRKGCGWRKSREGWGRCRLGQDCARRSLGLRWEAREESEPQAVRTVGCSRVTSPLWAPVSPAVIPQPCPAWGSVFLGSSSLGRLQHM